MKKLPKLSEKLKKDKKLLWTVAAGILGIVSVSYTPLDVYKRQQPFILFILFIKQNFAAFHYY